MKGAVEDGWEATVCEIFPTQHCVGAFFVGVFSHRTTSTHKTNTDEGSTRGWMGDGGLRAISHTALCGRKLAGHRLSFHGVHTQGGIEQSSCIGDHPLPLSLA